MNRILSVLAVLVGASLSFAGDCQRVQQVEQVVVQPQVQYVQRVVVQQPVVVQRQVVQYAQVQQYAQPVVVQQFVQRQNFGGGRRQGLGFGGGSLLRDVDQLIGGDGSLQFSRGILTAAAFATRGFGLLR